MTFKKLTGTIAATILMGIILAGCTSKVGGNMNQVIVDWIPENHSLVNRELEEHQSPAFGKALGFDVIAYPNENGFAPKKFYTIGDWFGQMEYHIGQDKMYVVRVAYIRGQNPLTKTYREPHSISKEDITIDGLAVEVRTSGDGCVMVAWTRGDYQYILHSNSRQGRPSDVDLNKFVQGLNSANI